MITLIAFTFPNFSHFIGMVCIFPWTLTSIINSERKWLWERVYRALFVTMITLIAFTFPNVSHFIGMVCIFPCTLTSIINSERHWLWEQVYRALFVTMITLIAFTFPNASHFIGMVCIFPWTLTSIINSEWHWLWERVYRALFVTMITLIAFMFPNVCHFIGMVCIFPCTLTSIINSERHWLWERVYRALFVTMITLISFTFPNIGSFCLSNMGFIFPAFIEITMLWEDPGFGYLRWKLWKCVFMIVFGVILCVVGTYTNTKGLIMSNSCVIKRLFYVANKGEEHEVLLFLVFTYRVWSFHSCTPLYLGVAVQLPSKATQFVHNNCCKQIVVRQRARWLSHSDGSGAAAAAVA
ncbi:putative proton-coupled amino acid transporter, partial [Operophtera brumata]